MNTPAAFRPIKSSFVIKMMMLCSIFMSALLCQSNAQSYNYSMGKEAFDKGDFQTAKEYLDKELSENKKNGAAYSLRSYINNYNDNKPDALSDLNMAIRYTSSKEKKVSAYLFYMRGDLYYNIEEYDNALNDYNTAIKLNDNNEEYFEGRGKLYIQTGAYELALKDFESCLKLNDGNVSSRCNKAWALVFLERFDEAEEVIGKALNLDPRFAWGYKLRAHIHSKRSEKIKAIDDIFEAYACDPTNNGMKNSLLQYSDSNKNYALNKLNAKISQNPDALQWLEMRARIYPNVLEYDKAIADINRCLELCDQQDRDYYLYYRAYDFFEAGNYDAAIRDFSEIVKNNPNDCWNKYYIAEANKRKGNYTEALRYYDSAVNCAPSETFPIAKRAILKYQFLHDNEGALADFDQAIEINNNAIYLYDYKANFLRICQYKTEQLQGLWKEVLDRDTSIDRTWNYKQFALLHLGQKEEAIAYQEKILHQSKNQQCNIDAARFYALLGDEEKTLDALRKTIGSGTALFYEMEHYPELKSFMTNPQVAKFVKEQKENFIKKNASVFDQPQHADSAETHTSVIPMKPRGSGTYEVNCKVNDLGLNFIFDTGASDISISQTEALFMLKNGYLSNNDIAGSRKYIDANGDIEVGTKIILKKVDFGGVILKNVSASVVNNKKAPLLFGQSALSKYGKIEIDNEKNTITITLTERK